MRVHIATDHAGMELSSHLVTALSAEGYEMVDHGPTAYNAEDDYPSFCIKAATAVVADQDAGMNALGVVLGGSGNGEQIAANKVRGVRAALAWNLDTARLARGHNDANVVAVGGRQHTVEEATEVVKAFLAEPFSNAERHVRRIAQIAVYESTDQPARADSRGRPPALKGSENRQKTVLPLPVEVTIMDTSGKTSRGTLQVDD